MLLLELEKTDILKILMIKNLDLLKWLLVNKCLKCYLVHQVKSVIKDALVKTIPKYRDDLDLQSILDFFQNNVRFYVLFLKDQDESKKESNFFLIIFNHGVND